MFYVSGGTATGMVSSEQPTIEDALAKAAEFMSAGMSHVGILAADGTIFSEREIDLLVEIERAQGGHSPGRKGR